MPLPFLLHNSNMDPLAKFTKGLPQVIYMNHISLKTDTSGAAMNYKAKLRMCAIEMILP